MEPKEELCSIQTPADFFLIVPKTMVCKLWVGTHPQIGIWFLVGCKSVKRITDKENILSLPYGNWSGTAHTCLLVRRWMYPGPLCRARPVEHSTTKMAPIQWKQDPTNSWEGSLSPPPSSQGKCNAPNVKWKRVTHVHLLMSRWLYAGPSTCKYWEGWGQQQHPRDRAVVAKKDFLKMYIGG